MQGGSSGPGSSYRDMPADLFPLHSRLAIPTRFLRQTESSPKAFLANPPSVCAFAVGQVEPTLGQDEPWATLLLVSPPPFNLEVEEVTPLTET